MKSPFKEGQTLFATGDHPEAINAAKEYIKDMRLEGKVKVLRHDGMLLVVAKENIECPQSKLG